MGRTPKRTPKTMKKSAGYSKKVTRLLLESKDKKSWEAAKATNTVGLKCPAGKIKRRAYIRKDKRTGKKTAVAASCIKNRGAPGKAKRTILMSKNRELGRYGYKDIKKMNKKDRQKAVEKAIKAYGYVDVIRKLGAIASLQTRTDPNISKRARSDQHFASKLYREAKAKGLPPSPR